MAKPGLAARSILVVFQNHSLLAKPLSLPRIFNFLGSHTLIIVERND